MVRAGIPEDEARDQAQRDFVFERLALELGAEEAGLAVFAGNTTALSLYESPGYRVTVRIMRKTLRPAATG